MLHLPANEPHVVWHTQVLNEQGNKGPLRFLEGIEVEEVTLGMVPPRLHVCHARFSPSHNYLQLETEADIYSSGFQLIVSAFLQSSSHVHA